MTASMGHATRVGAGSASPVTEEYEFVSCGLAKQGNIVVPKGIRGTRAYRDEGLNAGTYVPDGPLVLEPRPDDLDNWLPRILGGTEAADVFEPAETLPDFYVTVDKVAKVYTYAGVKVGVATFRSSAGNNLELAMDLFGKTESEAAAGTFPDIAATLSALAPFIHHQAVFTYGGSAYEIDNVEVKVDNALVLDKFNNSQTRTEIPEGDRIVTVSFDNPFDSDGATLYADSDGADDVTLVYTSGSLSLTFTFGHLRLPPKGPQIPGRTQEVTNRLEYRSYETTTTPEIKVTNVSA